MGGAIGGLFGGGAPTPPQVNVYQPSGTASQDTNLQGLLNQNTNLTTGANNPYSMMSPQLMQVFQSLFNNPAQGGYAQAGQQAGQDYTGVGNNALMNSTSLSGAVNPLLTGANSVMQMGFDPQSALYAQQLQKTNDAANVNNAQYGLTGQQAAGNVNQADTNFNIDWQNNQLQRALAGLEGGAKGSTAAGLTGINASSLGNSGAASILAGGSTPYATNTAIGTVQGDALNAYIQQLLGPVTSSQGTISNLQSYLNEGVSASAQGAQAANQAYQEQLAGSQGIGNMLGSLGNFLFSPTSSGGGPSNFASGASWLSDLFGSSGGASAGASVFEDPLFMDAFAFA